MQKKRGEAGRFPGSVVFDVTGVKDSFKGTELAGEVGEAREARGSVRRVRKSSQRI